MIFTIHELRLVVKVVIFDLEKELKMQKESCCQRGWQHRAFQLKGQLLQRGGVGDAGQYCGDIQGRRKSGNRAQFRTPPTFFSWVPMDPSIACLIIDFLYKVVDSKANYSKPWKLLHTTQEL